MADRDTVSDWHARQDAARRAMADHGLGANADNFARLPDRGRADPLAIIVIGAAVSFGVVLGAILRGMWG